MSIDSDGRTTPKCSSEAHSSSDPKSTLPYVDFYTELPFMSFDFDVPLESIPERCSESKDKTERCSESKDKTDGNENIESKTISDEPSNIELLPSVDSSSIVNQGDDILGILADAHSLMMKEMEGQHPEADKENFRIEGSTRYTEMGLKNGPKRHSIAKYFICVHCNKQFDRRADLSRHKDTHTVLKKNFRCDLCGSTFSRKDTFLRHTKIEHSTEDKKLVCYPCGIIFSRNDNFSRHKLKKHSN